MLDARGRRERGLRVYKKMGWGENAGLKEVDEEVWSLTTDFIFGEIWSRPGLSLRDRELVTLASLIAIGSEGMSVHMRHSHKLGITDKEIKEVILQVMYYVGQPRGFFAMRRLKAEMAERPPARGKKKQR
ncbi:MAG: carboxymuconolactone decarboxylase family protein [Betaproteobacteria bacterium]|nr:carboxymuconolactone decarboxylase family protein [Betaproteobacteria bacterium]